jgi:von Willebrand factor type A domain
MIGKRRGRSALLIFSLLAVVVLVGAAASTGSPKAASKPVTLDVEIAIDTTGSMSSSIAQAQTDAKSLVSDIRARYASAEFSTVQFRDSSDTPEYQIMQAMTGDATAIDTSIDTLTADGGGDSPEALNLVFQNALDPANPIGWRAGSRRILVVISDAEPHGAGTAGFKGCVDTSADPHGLSTSTVLANLKATGVTVLMVRQASSATATLECYQSLAAAGYPTGSAKNGGDKLVDVVEAMIVKVVTGTASPVGLWRVGSYRYRWVAISKGFEERSMTPHKLKHGCLVRRGDAVDRYYPKGNNLYRVAYRYWHVRAGGAGRYGTNCRKYWRAPEATVRIVVTSTQMTLSCDNKPNKACYTYRRVGS